MTLKTTKQVAETLRRTRSQLHLLLFRYAELKPAQKDAAGNYLWTEEEIQRVVTHRETHKRGRLRKK